LQSDEEVDVEDIAAYSPLGEDFKATFALFSIGCTDESMLTKIPAGWYFELKVGPQ